MRFQTGFEYHGLTLHVCLPMPSRLVHSLQKFLSLPLLPAFVLQCVDSLTDRNVQRCVAGCHIQVLLMHVHRGPAFSTRAFFLCDDDPCNDLLFSRGVWTVMLPGKFLGARGQGIPRPICQTGSLGGGRDSCFPKTISLSFLRFPSHHALEKESSLTYPVNLMQSCRKQYFPNCMVGC
jgi:hypothetical protein